jgi:P27 family predicted phage terminase small subunit
MARRPIPATIHILHGNPSRIRQDVLKREAEAVPAAQKDELRCPSWIKGKARAEWNWLVPRLLRYRLLADIDRVGLEQYVMAYARWREAEDHLANNPKVMVITRRKEQFPIRNPWLSIARDEFKKVQISLMQFGLTPSARAMILAKGRDELPQPVSPGEQKRIGNGSGDRSIQHRPDPLGILG